MKRYPSKFQEQANSYKKQRAQLDYDKGTRSRPDNFGGIPNLGTILRSYLKFLFYKENPTKIYPNSIKPLVKKSKITYWIIQPGPQANYWEELYEKDIIAIGWDYLGDASIYETKDEVQQIIKEHDELEHEPSNSSLAIWEFTKVMKPDDIVYVKNGVKKLLGRGKIVGDYSFDESREAYQHTRQVEWTHKGEWELDSSMGVKVLTEVTKKAWIEDIEKMFFGKNIEKISEEKKYAEWLSQERKSDGMPYDEKIIELRIKVLKDLEKDFNITIFNQSDVDSLEEAKEKILDAENNGSYKKHTSNIKTSIDSFIQYTKTKPTEVIGNEPYSDEDYLNDVFIEKSELQGLKSILKHKKNLVLKGAPGVGKTYIADRLAYSIMGEKDDSRIHFIQFHQSYSYEDFIEGYRPKEESDGFSLVTGPFVSFCEKAKQDKRPYFFIIDEINRGNMSRIFGEMMMLIEADKRGKSVNLLYSNRLFSIPNNVYIIGTMNTADRSLAMLDYALRRRFAFYDLKPAFLKDSFTEFIREYENTELIDQFIKKVVLLNKKITESFGDGFQIGHSYFTDSAIKENTGERLKEILEYEIVPQLREYWFDDLDVAEKEADVLRSILYE